MKKAKKDEFRKIAETRGYVINRKGDVFNEKGTPCKHITAKEKLYVYIFNEDGFRKRLLVKDLVLWTFFEKRHYEIEHKDGNPRNCHLDNLEYSSSKKVYRKTKTAGSELNKKKRRHMNLYMKVARNIWFDGLDKKRLITEGSLDSKIYKSIMSIRKAVRLAKINQEASPW